MLAACGSRAIQAVLEGLELQRLEAGRVVLKVPPGLARTTELRREEITQAVSRAAGRVMVVELIAAPEGAGDVVPRAGEGIARGGSQGAEAPGQGRERVEGQSHVAGGQGAGAAVPAPRAAPQPLPASSMSDHPLVRQAGELLNARLIRVERRESTDG